MSRIVYRISIFLNVFWLLATSAAGAAEPPSRASDDFDRWIPSIALTIGFTSQVHKGTVDSCALTQQTGPFGTPFGPFFCTTDPPNPLRRRSFADDQKNFTALQVGGTLELQTPRLLPYKWSPRIFVGGEIVNVSAQRRTIAREGNPSRLPGEDELPAIFPSEAILGQGSATTSDADTVLYGARIGVSVPIQIGDWRISIKPSARYLNQEIDFQGVVLNANRSGFFSDLAPTQTIEIRGSDSLDVHAVGPGLEIEIDAARVGSLAASVFVSGGAYRVLSDRRTSFSGRARDSLDTTFFQADFTTEIDPWIYRASLGFRVKWLGMPSGWLGRGD